MNERVFGEGIKITNSPEREKPLFVVMRSLAEAGIKAGVDLRFDGGEVRFDHRWVLLTAEKIV